MLPPFHIHKSKDNQYYFTIVSGNGQVLATSETYKKKQYCKDGINDTIRLIFPADVRSLPQSHWILDKTKKVNNNGTKQPTTKIKSIPAADNTGDSKGKV